MADSNIEATRAQSKSNVDIVLDALRAGEALEDFLGDTKALLTAIRSVGGFCLLPADESQHDDFNACVRLLDMIEDRTHGFDDVEIGNWYPARGAIERMVKAQEVGQ